MYGDHTWGYMSNGMFGIPFILFVFIVIVVILLAFRSGEKNSSEEDTAKGILKKRYAKGEIDEKEYHKMLKELCL